jgi:TRAP-type C4-dicarboxylate transport system substrate-binding protein
MRVAASTSARPTRTTPIDDRCCHCCGAAARFLRSSVMNNNRGSVAAAVAVALMTSVLAGCPSSPKEGTAAAAADHGYTGKSVTLTIGTDDSPGVPSADQISHFAEQVAKLSAGRIKIEPRWHAEGEDHPLDWDQAVARMVQSGRLDLALGPTWAWDVLGVTSLQPLQAPFLVDSDPLVAAVVRDPELAGQLMSGLAQGGVAGISMWPEGLRHPFGYETPLTGPQDFAGETIRSAKSRAITQLFKALGATTSAKEPDATTMAGGQSEFVLNPNGIATADITFFPKVNLLYANADTYAALDDQVVDILNQAAAETQTWAIDQTSDASASEAFCADGGTVITAKESDVEALKQATSGVVRDLAAPPGNAAVIDAISELKSTTDGAVAAGTCAGPETKKHEPGKAEAALDGTYRYALTPQEFDAAGIDPSQAFHNAGVMTYRLEDGHVHFRLDPSERPFGTDPAGPDANDGTYQVDGNTITFSFPSFNEVDRMLVEVRSDGSLQMTPLDIPDADVEFLMTSEPWERIH